VIKAAIPAKVPFKRIIGSDPGSKLSKDSLARRGSFR
jgi:hypothetical protein